MICFEINLCDELDEQTHGKYIENKNIIYYMVSILFELMPYSACGLFDG